MTIGYDGRGKRIIRKASVCRACGPRDGRSLREIVSTLTAEGHRTKRGGQWYPPAIASLLDTERV